MSGVEKKEGISPAVSLFLRAERKKKKERRSTTTSEFFFLSPSLRLSPRSCSLSLSSLSSFSSTLPPSPQKPERRHEGSCFSPCALLDRTAPPPALLAQFARDIRRMRGRPDGSEKQGKEGSRRRRRQPPNLTTGSISPRDSPLSSFFLPPLPLPNNSSTLRTPRRGARRSWTSTMTASCE